jgi:hypothetical protein
MKRRTFLGAAVGFLAFPFSRGRPKQSYFKVDRSPWVYGRDYGWQGWQRTITFTGVVESLPFREYLRAASTFNSGRFLGIPRGCAFCKSVGWKRIREGEKPCYEVTLVFIQLLKRSKDLREGVYPLFDHQKLLGRKWCIFVATPKSEGESLA